MTKQAFNPYLPSWEYTPDCEPYVFGDRVYVYGSHDRFNSLMYCLNDYVCWSAPVDDLSDWRYEGVIYKKTDDPLNPRGNACLYAPDVTQGPDGRYYLYYCLDKFQIVSVAVCDTPAGKYEFYGYVHYKDGTKLGERQGDEPQFDPGVLTEGDRTYLYTGFCAIGDRSRSGAMATVLDKDMVTIIEDPVIIAPSEPYSAGSGYEGHEFFEAPSMRKVGDTYYFVYSSILNYEMCYATSKHPTKDFVYRGIIITNNDVHIDSYKPAEMPTYYGGNDHGSIIEINGQWYIFHHRHTNGSNFSRQDCAEKIEILPDGSIPQVEMTSCGLNDGPLIGKGEYPAYIACNLFCDHVSDRTGWEWMNPEFPKITQDGRDGEEEVGYICNMKAGATAGYKYFDCKGVSSITLKARGYGSGAFEISTSIDGEVLATIPVQYSNIWEEYSSEINIPDGICALYIKYTGQGTISLKSFLLD
ncbi:MAG: alpha-N-arabinofuranosidase [Lachnospiraceae bacterium]|nr:alpha-N-arabinofuranosidase [Lachnospiraceae bacterium]